MMTLYQASKLTEDEARNYLESIRWPEGPVCPHCGEAEHCGKLEGDAHRAGLYKCYGCRKQFTVTVGTVMHRSKIALGKWVMAFHLLTSSKKGISALQLQRNLGLGSYRTAWHMAHRIRLAMREEPLAGMLLKGTVEVDEVYIGGKPRRRARSSAERAEATGKEYRRGPAPDFKDRKTPVIALVERGGRVRSGAPTDVTAENLHGAIRRHVDPSARLMTDERRGYIGIGREFAGGHHTVNHSRYEYVRGDVYTNTVESYFALLQRGVTGIYHNVSRKHLDRYCEEFNFRWNSRDVSDGVRAARAIRGADGKRLTYKPIKGMA